MQLIDVKLLAYLLLVFVSPFAKLSSTGGFQECVFSKFSKTRKFENVLLKSQTFTSNYLIVALALKC